MDLRQMNIDPREALAVGALAHDLLKPRRVDDLEAFLARYPHITQYIEQYLGFGYASIPPEVVSGLGAAAQLQSAQAPNAQVPEELLTPFTEVANAEGDNQPQPGPDAKLL
jgi:hypothetical protein